MPADAPAHLLSTHQAFAHAFGVSPTHFSSAPGRVNLIGEHTDYSGGMVLPMALSLRCFAVGALASAANSEVLAVDLHQRTAFDLTRVAPDYFPPGNWARYVAGTLACLARAASLTNPLPIRIALSSAVPPGAGLSSSAALEVSVATLAAAMWGLHFDPIAIARACQEAEHTFAGVPCGIMDQLISVRAERGHALLIDCRSLDTTPIPLPAATDAVFVVADSRVKHALGSGEYAKRRASCESAAAVLGVSSLRDATIDLLRTRHADLTDDQLVCALHVIGENQRVRRFADALRRGDLPAAGRAMTESHRSLRDDFRVSCSELDTLVSTALATPGVHGSRLTGAGFGGCTVTLCHPDSAPSLTCNLTAALTRLNLPAPNVFIARSDQGAAVSRLSSMGEVPRVL